MEVSRDRSKGRPRRGAMIITLVELGGILRGRAPAVIASVISMPQFFFVAKTAAWAC